MPMRLSHQGGDMRPEITREPGDAENNAPRHLIGGLSRPEICGLLKVTEHVSDRDKRRGHPDELDDSMPIVFDPWPRPEGVYIGETE